MDNKIDYDDEAFSNYTHLKKNIDEAFDKVKQTTDLREAKGYLIDAQNHFKGLKLYQGDREQLYERLQQAFAEINKKIEDERLDFENEATQNYFQLKTKVDEAVAIANNPKDFQQAWNFLIEVQSLFKGKKLLHQHRETLYARLQHAFDALKSLKEAEKTLFEKETVQNYTRLKKNIADVIEQIKATESLKLSRELLIKIQSELRETRLRKEQRDELYGIIQQNFEILNQRFNETRQSFEKEACKNYEQLKTLVNNGLTQAQETSQYKETREFLKKIQSEFKGIRLAAEQREELYSRLQTAFDILNQRLDDFFRQKKKNWEVKMQYKLAELSAEISTTEETLEDERANLRELEDQLDIVISAGKEKDAVAGLKARIASARLSIERKEKQIQNLGIETDELKNRLEPEE